YVHRIVEDSVTIKKAARDEEESLKEIVNHLEQDFNDILRAIDSHEKWFGITHKNAPGVLAGIITQVTHAIQTANALKRLRKAGTPRFVNMAELGGKLFERLVIFKEQLLHGFFKTKVDALRGFREQVAGFNEELKKLIGEEYSVLEEFMRREIA
ncbi:hypothetical protein KY339_02065, partial [Candidatus Woesearchaeota archaeon]|nr:hypothetical protein [Candidatus Woesearchaeota archaeon]